MIKSNKSEKSAMHGVFLIEVGLEIVRMGVLSRSNTSKFLDIVLTVNWE